MKTVCVVVALVMLVAAPLTLWSAEDGAAIFKAKCVACHGEKGEGKPAMQMPAVKGTKMSAEEIVKYLNEGVAGKKVHNPNNKMFSTLNDEQKSAVAAHVKTLK
jgi:cytochrome c553